MMLKSKRRRWLLGGLLSLVLVTSLTGCQALSFYKQAIQGQCQIYWTQRPIAKVLKDAETPEAVKEKLGLILTLRTFAEQELGLRPNGHYLKYADLQRRFVVWNVYAAPELSLDPKRWWYPMVGRLKYRGFFSEKAARHYGSELAKEGLDVFVGGVEAYSTLGWFRDPVLNTFLHHKPADLAEIVFHELTHQKVFAKGDTDFNEALATAVGEEGVHRWLATLGNTNAVQEYLLAQERNEEFVHLVMAARNELKQLYGDEENPEAKGGTSPSTSDRWKREQKQKIITRLKADYARLKSDWGGYSSYDRWFSQPINNAQINTIATYYDLVPYFRRLLEREKGDLKQFYAVVEKLAELKGKDERHEALKKLAGEPQSSKLARYENFQPPPLPSSSLGRRAGHRHTFVGARSQSW